MEFQSTLPRREWPFLTLWFLQYIMISIHTPTKGVTSINTALCKLTSLFQSTLPRREWPGIMSSVLRAWNFNPHSHEGSDRRSIITLSDQRRFQSTLPRREWPRLIRIRMRMLDFNPHSHEGSDSDYSEIYGWRGISIHTPTKGVTVDHQQETAEEDNFNPHSHEGSDSDTHF